MSEKTDTNTLQSEERIEDKTLSSESNETNSSTSTRLFGQFNKINTLAFQNSSNDHHVDSDDQQPKTNSYFTNTLSKISSISSTGFGSSSTPLAASLASLDANKPLFGGSSATTPSSFTDLKTTSTKTLEDDEDKSSLLETVAEYEAKRASTHPSTTNIQGDTSTGEENEINKFQIAGKLFMYNGEQQQFVERGFGILKINESHEPSNWDKLQARLIMRLDKSFRVILNSPIFAKMTVERVTDRSVRFGAQDEGQLRIFILKASSNDCHRFYDELQSRIEIVQRQQQQQSPTKHNTSSSSTSSDVFSVDDESPRVNRSVHNRKRSHSQSESDSSPTTNDLSKKSKLVENDRNPSTTVELISNRNEVVDVAKAENS